MQENKENRRSIDRSMVKDKNKTEREPEAENWKKMWKKETSTSSLCKLGKEKDFIGIVEISPKGSCFQPVPSPLNEGKSSF